MKATYSKCATKIGCLKKLFKKEYKKLTSEEMCVVWTKCLDVQSYILERIGEKEEWIKESKEVTFEGGEVMKPEWLVESTCNERGATWFDGERG